MSNQPWICPRCATVNAPHVNQCSCVPAQAVRPSPPVYPWQAPSKKYWIGDPPWGTGTVTYPADPWFTITLSDRTSDSPIYLGGYAVRIAGA